MSKIYISFFVFFTLFISCEKLSEKEPCELKNIQISSNSPVIEGWPIYLSTRPSQTERFNWAGPNGQITTQGAQNDIQVLNAKLSDSGSYSLTIMNTFGCTEYSGTTFIKVISPPAAPCSITNNTSTSTVIGVGGNNYTYVSFTNNSATAYPYVASSNEALQFRFFGNTAPKPGLYKTNGSIYSLDKENEVGCYISTFPASNFVNKEGQDVYVTRVNGKLQIAFCDCQFTNPVGTAVIKISARITQP
jgi:hypothetical protein